MQSEKQKAFKNKLRSYTWLTQSIKQTKSNIEDAEYLMANVKAIRYDKEPSGYVSELEKLERIEKYSAEIQRLTELLAHYEKEKSIIDEALEKMSEDVQEIIKLVYVYEKATFNKLSFIYHYSPTALRKKVNREIEKFF